MGIQLVKCKLGFGTGTWKASSEIVSDLNVEMLDPSETRIGRFTSTSAGGKAKTLENMAKTAPLLVIN